MKRATFLDLDDPAVLEHLCRTGAIWENDKWWDRAIEFIRGGGIPLEECADVPEEVVYEITGEDEPDNEFDAEWYAMTRGTEPSMYEEEDDL